MPLPPIEICNCPSYMTSPTAFKNCNFKKRKTQDQCNNKKRKVFDEDLSHSVAKKLCLSPKEKEGDIDMSDDVDLNRLHSERATRYEQVQKEKMQTEYLKVVQNYCQFNSVLRECADTRCNRMTE
eukprot:Platyproteum_vivax@DN4439_c0_g1_i1.p1